MKEEKIYILVEQELAGQLSEKDRKDLQEWLNQDVGNQALYEEVKTILTSTSSILGGIDPQTNTMWEALRADLEEEAVEESPATVIPMKRRRFTWIAVAAAVALLAAVGFWYANPGATVNGGGETLVYSVGNGKTMSLTLPDDSRIMLNAGSKLELASDFGKTTRTVHLEGEAYFDVARDESKPFIIESFGQTQTKVLGTSFNICAYPGLKNVDIDVMSGKVAFSSMASGEQVELVAEEGASCHIADGHVKMMEKEDVSGAEWRRGKLVFKGTPIVDALVILEKHYDLQFEVAPNTQGELLSATYDTRSFDEEKLLKNLRTTLSVNIEKKGRRVYIAK